MSGSSEDEASSEKKEETGESESVLQESSVLDKVEEVSDGSMSFGEMLAKETSGAEEKEQPVGRFSNGKID